MQGKITNADFNQALTELQKEYLLYAPKRFPDKGRFSDTDMIRYGEISSLDEIVWQEKSFFSPKEIIFPITQTIFLFTDDEFREAKLKEKRKSLVFLRPCDINGFKRLDEIYLKNGKDPDLYYQRLREKVKFAMIECKEGFDSCFCVSMDANKTDDYDMAIRLQDDSALLDIKDQELAGYFNATIKNQKFKPEFTSKNKIKVNVPEIDEMPKEMFEHEMWDEYSSRCIACGRCNTTCVTCSCFDTYDLFSDDNTQVGERRRVWSCCHVDGFTDIAGGHSFRKKNGERMRFKTFHKIYDFKKRFGEHHMCVGCGRCNDSCPEYISFSNCINKVTDNLKNLSDKESKCATIL